MKPVRLLIALLFLALCLAGGRAHSQACSTLGQTPSTAFPVCGTSTFSQNNVPICSTNNLYVPGCSIGSSGGYANKNPFFYKFTCFVSGTLSFLITPNMSGEDYDWQLYDVTGHNPDDIFTDSSLVVTGNWSGTFGNTGASSSGVNFIQCGSVPSDNLPTFAISPNLIQGHEYLLMISHFSDTQSGYSLSFGGGTAVITDATQPHLFQVKTDCNGQVLTLKLNKKVRCNSLTPAGTEFSITPANANVIGATTISCSSAFDMDEITIQLSGVLPNGNYNLVINNGSDGNSLLDFCGNAIPVLEQVPFQYQIPQPIFADSIGRLGCSPDLLKVYFPKKIDCSTIAADGSDFSISGPTVVPVASATGNCVNGKTDYVIVKFSAPIYTQGNYTLRLKTGTDGTTVVDECGLQSPQQTLPFNTVDTVSAQFTYTTMLGCTKDTVNFSHNGANAVNSWNWVINNGNPIHSQNLTFIFSSSSNNDIKLTVSNGICKDTVALAIPFNNEVKASFTIPDNIICPEDLLAVTNTSTGLINSWQWKFDILSTSTLKDPPPFQFPNVGRNSYYSIKLMAFNTLIPCTDTATRTLTVLDFCSTLLPSAFTPNNDGLNDDFGPHNAIKADNYDFKIFNRWGQLIFQSNDWNKNWDGKLKGIPQPMGVYVWMFRFKNPSTGNPVFQKGTVTLIR